MLYLDRGGRGPGLIPAGDASLPATDRGFLYGDGLFETVLVRDGAMPLLPWHLERLTGSARALDIPADPDRVREGVQALAGADCATGEFALRVTLTRGTTAKRGYEPAPDSEPTLLISAAPYHRPSGPLSAVTASGRVCPDSCLTRHKTISALEKVVARGEAARAGCDEALLLNTTGRIAEGAAANLFVVRQGLWLTPPLSEGCLPGVMRRRVMELTHAVEWPLQPDDLFRSEGVYLTNALIGCLPLAALDGRGLPWGSAPPFVSRLFEPKLR